MDLSQIVGNHIVLRYRSREPMHCYNVKSYVSQIFHLIQVFNRPVYYIFPRGGSYIVENIFFVR